MSTTIKKNNTKEVQMVSGMVTLKMSNKYFINKFSPSFNELKQVPSNPKSGKLKFAIKKTVGSIEDAIERYIAKRQDIFEERCKLDGEGNPLIGEDKSYLFETPELRKEAKKLTKELDNEEIKLRVYPIRKVNLIDAIGGAISIGSELNLEGFILLEEEE